MSINGTLAFVILWIVNALIALVYLLVGIFLYVPACDLKREQGEEIQYDNRRAFFIRFIVMVLCPVVGPAFFLCSYLLFPVLLLQDGIPPGGRSGRCYFQQGTCADTSESGRGAGAQHGAAGRIACRQ